LCTPACINFGSVHLKEKEIAGKAVLEVGAFDVNGSLRSVVDGFSPAKYVGTDITEGPGVDLVCDAYDLLDQFGCEAFDVLICTEMLEHVRDWKRVISNFKKVLKPEGIILVTTRSKGFGYHSYPDDFWRYEIEDVIAMFPDFKIEALESDPEDPGIFFKVRKPADFKEADLSNYALFSMIKGKRVITVSDEEVAEFNTMLDDCGLREGIDMVERRVSEAAEVNHKVQVGLGEAIQILRADISLKEAQKIEKEIQHAKAEKEIIRLRAEIAPQRAEITRLRAEMKQMNTHLIWLNNTLEEKDQNTRELEQTLARLETDLRALHSTYTVRFSRIAGVLVRSSRQLLGDIRNRSIQGRLDWPAPQTVVSKVLKVKGWAISTDGFITQVEVILDNISLGNAYYGAFRPDVAAMRPLQVGADCGYTGDFAIDEDLFQPSSKTLLVRITDSKGRQHEITQDIVIEAPEVEPEELLAQSPYEEWIFNSEPSEAELKQQRAKSQELVSQPLVSILTPVFNSPGPILRATIESVLDQTYGNWELCLVDGASTLPEIKEILSEYAKRDTRIQVKFLEENRGISENSNVALQMAKGEFIALLDHDDTLSSNALYENVLLLNHHPDADMIYSDEDKLDETGKRCDPYFKPDWSPDFFLSHMYTCHLGVYRTRLLKEVGYFRSEFDGTQDYDMVLRLIERTNRIYHIPKVLYHWRMSSNSTSASLENKIGIHEIQIKAVQAYIERVGLNAVAGPGIAEDTIRVKYLLKEQPRVSIIIPTRDQAPILKQCLESIKSLTAYSNYEIVIVDNDSSELETTNYLASLGQYSNIRILKYPGAFNYSAINNFAVSQVDSELILLLNNDIEVIDPNWLDAMVEHATRPEVGAVGARLLYPNQTLQHGGVIIGLGGIAGHSHKHLPAKEPGYFCRAKSIQNFSAVTGACLMTRTSLFRELGGLDEKNLAVAFNDVDLCLRIREKGLLIVWTPFAELVHHESVSRGPEDNPEKIRRFQAEMRFMYRRWIKVIRHDPYYSPNLTQDRENFALAPCSRFTTYYSL
jgi:glycosyltransferase involved in cell wall biosynthesis/SAM-dependent methyltransferase